VTNLLDQFPETTEDSEIALLHAKNFEAVAIGAMREAVKYARKCCRGSLGDDELVSICYPALLQAAENYKTKFGLKFFSFAKQYVRGAISREWRRKDVVRNSSRYEDEDAPVEVVIRRPDDLKTVNPDFESLDVRERWDLIWPVMQRRLNDVERMVLVLRYKSGFSYEEIGKLRGVTRQAIQRTHACALKKLRCALEHKRSLL